MCDHSAIHLQKIFFLRSIAPSPTGRGQGVREHVGLRKKSLTLTLSQREGGALSCIPSADAVAGNGRPLSWAPSADAVAGGGNR